MRGSKAPAVKGAIASLSKREEWWSRFPRERLVPGRIYCSDKEYVFIISGVGFEVIERNFNLKIPVAGGDVCGSQNDGCQLEAVSEVWIARIDQDAVRSAADVLLKVLLYSAERRKEIQHYLTTHSIAARVKNAILLMVETGNCAKTESGFLVLATHCKIAEIIGGKASRETVSKNLPSKDDGIVQEKHARLLVDGGAYKRHQIENPMLRALAEKDGLAKSIGLKTDERLPILNPEIESKRLNRVRKESNLPQPPRRKKSRKEVMTANAHPVAGLEICHVFEKPLSGVSIEDCSRQSATPRRNILHCSKYGCAHPGRICYQCYLQGASKKWPKDCYVKNPQTGFCRFHEESGMDARRPDGWNPSLPVDHADVHSDVLSEDGLGIISGNRVRIQSKIRPRFKPQCQILGIDLEKTSAEQCIKKCGQEFWNRETCSPIKCRHPKRLCSACVQQGAAGDPEKLENCFVVSTESDLCAGHMQYGRTSKSSEWPTEKLITSMPTLKSVGSDESEMVMEQEERDLFS